MKMDNGIMSNCNYPVEVVDSRNLHVYFIIAKKINRLSSYK